MNRDEFLDFLADLDNVEDDDARFTALFKAVGDIYQEEVSKRDNEDYEIDADWMRHFTEFTSFLARIAREGDGRVEIDLHEPRESMAGITGYFPVFDLAGGSLREFCKLLVWASAWSIDALRDGTVRISVRFNRIYRKKRNVKN